MIGRTIKIHQRLAITLLKPFCAPYRLCFRNFLKKSLKILEIFLRRRNGLVPVTFPGDGFNGLDFLRRVKIGRLLDFDAVLSVSIKSVVLVKTSFEWLNLWNLPRGLRGIISSIHATQLKSISLDSPIQDDLVVLVPIWGSCTSPIFIILIHYLSAKIK
jgi:hypothetical protein